MPKKVLKSWATGPDGNLIEHDYKIYYDEDDYSYEIEVTTESLGVTLGVDSVSRKYTAISSIPDKKKMAKFLNIVHVGDVLVEMNGEVVLDRNFVDNIQELDQLIANNETRKLKFINRNKYTIEKYRQKQRLLKPTTSTTTTTVSNSSSTNSTNTTIASSSSCGSTSQTVGSNGEEDNNTNNATANANANANATVMRDSLGFECTIEYHLLEKSFALQQHNIRMKRDLEWVEYLKAIGGAENLKPAGIFKPLKDLKNLVRKGIPIAYRGLIWQKISLSSIYRLQYPTNYYTTLLSRLQKGELNEKIKNDIEKDIDRTFPEHQYFQVSGDGELILRRILQAFALHNPEIGYCQSLNFIVGMMIIFMQEEDAFWLFVTVVEQLLPKDYYTKSMVGTYVDQFVLSHIIKKFLPRIHSTFESNSLQLPLITVQWFMCIFVNTLRPEVTLRIWDIFLNEGNKVLFRIAAALFKLNESKLLHVKDASDLFNVLRTIGKDIMDADILITTAYRKYIPRAEIVIKHNRKKSSSRFGGNNNSNQDYRMNSNSTDRTVSGIQSILNDCAWNTDTTNDLREDSLVSIRMSDVQAIGGGKNNNAIVHSSSYLLSPRLMIKKAFHNGYVPSPLVGIGHAHLGPRILLETPPTIAMTAAATATEGVTTNNEVNNHTTDDINSIPAIHNLDEEFYKAVAVTAEEVSNELMAQEEGEISAGGEELDVSMNTITEEEDEEEGASEVVVVEGQTTGDHDHNDDDQPKENALVTTVIDTNKEDSSATTAAGVVSPTTSTTTTASEKHRIQTRESIDAYDPVFSNPALILNDIDLPPRIKSSKLFGNSQQQQPTKSPKAPRTTINPNSNNPNNNVKRFRNGEFLFSRQDIAIWRNSFRPGLQERYERMEKARMKWRATIDANNNNNGNTGEMKKVNIIKSIALNDNANIKMNNMQLLHPSETKEEHEEEEEVDSTNPSPVPLSPPLTPLASVIMAEFRRKSFDLGQIPQHAIDVEAINTTYSLDHEIAVQEPTQK